MHDDRNADGKDNESLRGKKKQKSKRSVMIVLKKKRMKKNELNEIK